MTSKVKKVTIPATPEIEQLIEKTKQMYCEDTESAIIRTLIIAGLDTLNNNKQNGKIYKSPVKYSSNPILHNTLQSTGVLNAERKFSVYRLSGSWKHKNR